MGNNTGDPMTSSEFIQKVVNEMSTMLATEGMSIPTDNAIPLHMQDWTIVAEDEEGNRATSCGMFDE